MKKQSVTLALDADAAALLIHLAGSPRKQGALVSRLIRERAGHAPDLARLTELERELALLRARLTAPQGVDMTATPSGPGGPDARSD